MTSNYLPYGIVYGAELLTSIKRMNEFLGSSEVEICDDQRKEFAQPTVVLTSVCTKWSHNTEKSLKDISFRVIPSTLIAVIGPVGCGKTTLLHTILKEVELTSGSIKINGTVAYTSQSPSIFSGTIRDNILFGKKFDLLWYETVIYACALSRDFELLPYGDKTYVADKGSTLSGGQKARISLARAIYRDADIYLLDDPLSALDSSVGKHILNHCILGLLKSKCVILVTHLTYHCRHASEILILEDGHVKRQGTYDELFASGEISVPDIVEKTNDLITDDDSPKIRRKKIKGQKLRGDLTGIGRVGWQVFWKYLRLGNGKRIIIFAGFLLFVNQLFLNGTDFLLKTWTAAAETEITERAAMDRQFLTIFAILLLPLFMAPFLRSIAHYWTSLRSATQAHSSIFRAVVFAPMRFFDLNPLGKILNRLSKDMSVADDILPVTLYLATSNTLEALGVFVLICLLNPILIIPSVFLLFVFYCIQNYYLAPAASISRLDTIAHGGVTAHLNTSLQCLATIRAYKAEAEFESRFESLQNIHSSATYSQELGVRWVGVIVQVFVFIYFTAVTYSFIYEHNTDPSAVGLAVPSVLNITVTIADAISQLVESKNMLVSIERILEYTKIEPEFKRSNSDLPLCLPPSWPRDGEIQFKEVRVSYIEGHDVLQNINCKINSQEKVGIVGRTGAGKTTLVSTVFRIVELNGGSIHIDGQDISKIELRDLRSRIAIIPQDPVLFEGLLRANLDPFGNYGDDALWRALEDTQLLGRMGVTGGLESHVAENGANFSNGVRQLISFARALLKNAKILILDEATAHVDSDTDAFIQKLVKEKFSSCTVLTIAHRLGTVLDSDRVCVMESGKIVEFDSPLSLLRNPESMLSQYLKKSNITKQDL